MAKAKARYRGRIYFQCAKTFWINEVVRRCAIATVTPKTGSNAGESIDIAVDGLLSTR